MFKEEVIAIFRGIVETPLKKDKFSCISLESAPNFKPSTYYMIYSWESLKYLIEKVKVNTIIDALEEKEQNTYRYIVTEDHKIWFAASGRMGLTINSEVTEQVPAHTDMVMLSGSGCISAGEIILSNSVEIVELNNKSGHYKPGFNVVAFALRILHAKGANFSADFKLSGNLDSTRLDLLECSLSRSDINDLVASLPDSLRDVSVELIDTKTYGCMPINSKRAKLKYDDVDYSTLSFPSFFSEKMPIDHSFNSQPKKIHREIREERKKAALSLSSLFDSKCSGQMSAREQLSSLFDAEDIEAQPLKRLA